MYRVGLVNKNGDVISKNFNNKKEAEEWLLIQAEQGIKKAIIVNKNNIKEREIITF